MAIQTTPPVFLRGKGSLNSQKARQQIKYLIPLRPRRFEFALKSRNIVPFVPNRRIVSALEVFHLGLVRPIPVYRLRGLGRRPPTFLPAPSHHRRCLHPHMQSMPPFPFSIPHLESKDRMKGANDRGKATKIDGGQQSTTRILLTCRTRLRRCFRLRDNDAAVIWD